MRHPTERFVDIVARGTPPGGRRRLDSIEPEQSASVPHVAPPNQRPAAVDAQERHRVNRSFRHHTVAIGIAEVHYDLVPHNVFDDRSNTRIGLVTGSMYSEPFA